MKYFLTACLIFSGALAIAADPFRVQKVFTDLKIDVDYTTDWLNVGDDPISIKKIHVWMEGADCELDLKEVEYKPKKAGVVYRLVEVTDGNAYTVDDEVAALRAHFRVKKEAKACTLVFSDSSQKMTRPLTPAPAPEPSVKKTAPTLPPPVTSAPVSPTPVAPSTPRPSTRATPNPPPVRQVVPRVTPSSNDRVGGLEQKLANLNRQIGTLEKTIYAQGGQLVVLKLVLAVKKIAPTGTPEDKAFHNALVDLLTDLGNLRNQANANQSLTAAWTKVQGSYAVAAAAHAKLPASTAKTIDGDWKDVLQGLAEMKRQLGLR